MLFDKVGLEHEGLNLIIDNNKLKICDYLNKLPRLWIVISARVEIRPHAVSQVLGLADINDLPSLVFMDIDTGVGRQGLKFFGDRHTLDFSLSATTSKTA